MKTFRSTLALLAALALPGLAHAQAFGQFTGASPLGVNSHLFGAYLQSSSSVLSLLAQLRLSFYPNVDFGFMGGFARQDFALDKRTTLRLGTDFKYQVLQPAEGRPVAVSVGGALGVETGDRFSILSLGPTVVASRTFAGNGDISFTPFAGAGLMISNLNVGSTNDSDVSYPLRIGSEVRFNPQLSVTAELQLHLSDSINDSSGFSIGVNSPF